MWLYAKAAIIAVLSISLILGGWKAATWRLEAQAAEVLRLELRAELERRVKADADRLSLQVKLSEAEARIGTGVRIVTKTIREYVQDKPDCRIAAPVSNGLRDLRAGNMPTAPAQLADGRAAP
jgi:hypothetical protein